MGRKLSEIGKRPSNFNIESEREKIRNGTYNKHINPGRQNRHIDGTKEYAKYEKELAKRGTKPSVLYEDAQTLIESHAGSGKIWSRLGNDAPPVEDVKMPRVIGKVWNGQNNQWDESSLLRIVYSKDGAHAYPIPEDE
jgi:hypothetical protein